MDLVPSFRARQDLLHLLGVAAADAQLIGAYQAAGGPTARAGYEWLNPVDIVMPALLTVISRRTLQG